MSIYDLNIGNKQSLNVFHRATIKTDSIKIALGKSRIKQKKSIQKISWCNYRR